MWDEEQSFVFIRFLSRHHTMGIEIRSHSIVWGWTWVKPFVPHRHNYKLNKYLKSRIYFSLNVDWEKNFLWQDFLPSSTVVIMSRTISLSFKVLVEPEYDEIQNGTMLMAFSLENFSTFFHRFQLKFQI